ncbi:hypothetical protein GJV26_14310 [Massilia dura]|uniref:Uncharacterized protein n=1 Tax=Pseudoduganella dura TaxID=321982 RepID=A0A6I3XD87_9BURK|nr:hypothetical protein [Pseudoduganella dura]MUI13626.1 hypothetical protein [Pseudoduganella dura]
MPPILYGLQEIVEPRQITIRDDIIQVIDAAAHRPDSGGIGAHRQLLETSIAIVSAGLPAVRTHMSAFCHKFVGRGFQGIDAYTIAT